MNKLENKIKHNKLARDFFQNDLDKLLLIREDKDLKKREDYEIIRDAIDFKRLDLEESVRYHQNIIDNTN